MNLKYFLLCFLALTFITCQKDPVNNSEPNEDAEVVPERKIIPGEYNLGVNLSDDKDYYFNVDNDDLNDFWVSNSYYYVHNDCDPEDPEDSTFTGCSYEYRVFAFISQSDSVFVGMNSVSKFSFDNYGIDYTNVNWENVTYITSYDIVFGAYYMPIKILMDSNQIYLGWINFNYNEDVTISLNSYAITE